MQIPPPLPHFQTAVLRAHTETGPHQWLSNLLPVYPCPGPSLLIKCDKKVWREQVRLVPKSLVIPHLSSCSYSYKIRSCPCNAAPSLFWNVIWGREAALCLGHHPSWGM